MALIKCTDCEKEVSDKAASCIHCGCPVEEKRGNGGYWYDDVKGIWHDPPLYDASIEPLSKTIGKVTISGNNISVSKVFGTDNYQLENINRMQVEFLELENKYVVKIGAKPIYNEIKFTEAAKARELYYDLARRAPNAKLADETNPKRQAFLAKHQVANTTPTTITPTANSGASPELEALEIKLTKQKLKDIKNQARCPKCKSTSLSGNKKGFGLLKGAAGVLVTGGSPLGAVTAGIGKKKVIITCMNCGKQFKA